VPVFENAADALTLTCDVFVEYTSAASAKANVLAALVHGAQVVVGSSRLTDADFVEIDARSPALTAGRCLPSWEIIETGRDRQSVRELDNLTAI
jgi:dihydrodipicolinate reductase